MNQQLKHNRSACCIFSLFIGFVVLLHGCVVKKEEKTETAKPVSKQENLLKHPIYSKYEFSKSENAINIGIQPLWTPTGLITEAIRHDIILRKALSELGLEIRFYSFLKGDDVNFFLNRGDLDTGIGGDMPAITAAATFGVIIPSIIQHGYISIVANRHMLLSELRGRSIGYAFGSNAHYALLNALNYEGVTESDVNLVPMDVTKMPEALYKREISAFSAWEPTPSIALSKYSDMVVVHRSASTGYLYFRKSFSDKNPRGVRQLVAAQIRAIRWMKKDTQNLKQGSQWVLSESKRLLGKKPELTVAQNMILAEEDLLGWASDAYIPKRLLTHNGSLNREFKFLKAIGKIPANSSWKRVRDSFNLEIVRQILTNQNKYSLNRFRYGTNDNDN